MVAFHFHEETGWKERQGGAFEVVGKHVEFSLHELPARSIEFGKCGFFSMFLCILAGLLNECHQCFEPVNSHTVRSG
jgi:hypothetical protein